jgi:hypothetical protein
MILLAAWYFRSAYCIFRPDKGQGMVATYLKRLKSADFQSARDSRYFL